MHNRPAGERNINSIFSRQRRGVIKDYWSDVSSGGLKMPPDLNYKFTTLENIGLSLYISI
jgi:hypothetical protein